MISACHFPPGGGIADILSGDVSPAGRLPVTMYARNYTVGLIPCSYQRREQRVDIFLIQFLQLSVSAVQSQIAATDMHMRTWPGRTYRFLQVPALFDFGFGLSYSTFEYGNLKVSQVHNDGQRQWKVTARCRNTGAVVSDEVMLLFAAFDTSTDTSTDVAQIEWGTVPNTELRAFKRLKAVRPQEVCFAMNSLGCG